MGRSQVVVANNLFINYNRGRDHRDERNRILLFPGAHGERGQQHRGYDIFRATTTTAQQEADRPSAEALGCRPGAGDALPRFAPASKVNASNVIIANNQVYVRDQCESEGGGHSPFRRPAVEYRCP